MPKRAGGADAAAVLALLAGCSDGSPGTAPDPAASPPPSPSAATTSTAAEPSPSERPRAGKTRRSHPAGPYRFAVPDEVRRDLFRQGAVPASFAKWIPTSEESVGGSYRGVRIDRRMPPCSDHVELDYPTDDGAADFADRLFLAGDYIVARQLTVYPDAATAERAVAAVGAHPTVCGEYDGRPVTAHREGEPAPDALGLSGGPDSVAALGGLATDGDDAAWWTVATRVRNAVVLTRVVDPHARVDDSGAPTDHAALDAEATTQARASAQALAAFR